MLLGGEQPRLPFVLEPVAFSTDVEHVAVVQQPVQHRRGDHGVAEQFAPLAEALVGSEDYAAPLVASRDQGEEGGGRLPVVGPDAELVLERTTRLWNSSRNGEVFLKQECSIPPVWGTPRDMPPSRVQRDGERLDPLPVTYAMLGSARPPMGSRWQRHHRRTRSFTRCF